MLYVCHCRDCQKQSSSAFGMSLIVSLDDVEFLQGRDLLKTWDTRGDDGLVAGGVQRKVEAGRRRCG